MGVTKAVAVLTATGVAILFVLLFFAFDMGQLSVIDSCEKLAFFYHRDKTFSCQPVKPIPHEVPK
jgi:hypothetical protein